MHHTLAWGIVDLFAGLNLLVAVFNLLPGLPLDGGRVLRAGLWWGLRDKVSATKGAAYAGRGLAGLVVLGTLSFVRFTGTNNTLTIFYGVLVAWFIWQSANQALVQVKIGAVLPSLGARGLTRRALRVSAELPLAEAVRRANETGSRALVVVDGRGEPDGIVPEAAVLAVPMERRPWVSVGSLARRIDASLRLSVDLTGQDLLTAMQQAPATEYLVVEQTGQVYGVLSQADVLAALRAAR
jgi:CBS domain-containing protein